MKQNLCFKVHEVLLGCYYIQHLFASSKVKVD